MDGRQATFGGDYISYSPSLLSTSFRSVGCTRRIAFMQPCTLWRYLVAFNRILLLLLLILYNTDIYLWVRFRDSPTNSPAITIGDNLGDSRTPSSTIFVSYVTHFYMQFLTRLQITRYYFPYKETNQVI